MRRTPYKEYKEKLTSNVIDSRKEQGRGQFRVIGDISMIYNPDGSLKIKEFARDSL
jgi:hypothetical protein